MQSPDLPFPDAIKADAGNAPIGFEWVEISPPADHGMNFGIVLPAEWMQEDDPIEKPEHAGQLARLAMFGESNAGPQSASVLVAYTVLEHDVHLFDWMQLACDEFDLDPLNWRVSRGPMDREIVEVLGLTGSPEDPFIARAVCFADWGRIIVVLSTAPMARYADLADAFALINGSFQLSLPVQPGHLENRNTIHAKSPDFHLEYPASWTPRVLEGLVEGKSAVELLLKTADATDLAGYIRIRGIDTKLIDDDPPATVRFVCDELAEAGVRIESAWEVDDDPIWSEIPNLISAHHAIGKLKKGPLEIYMILATRGNLGLCGVLLAPDSNDAPIEWMRAKYALIIALKTAQASAEYPNS